MKLKVTKKDIKESNNKILKIGYCQAQNLLNCENAFSYSSGVYGWSCDYYNIDGVIISTGYTPIGQEVSYNLIKKYDNKALKLQDLYYKDFDYKKHKKRMRKLIDEFISKALEG